MLLAPWSAFASVYGLSLLLLVLRGVAAALPAGPHHIAVPPRPPVVVPIDHGRLCVTWAVAGGGLPDSEATRCFEPFELGPHVSPGEHDLSPGTHTVTLSLADGEGAVVVASFVPAFDAVDGASAAPPLPAMTVYEHAAMRASEPVQRASLVVAYGGPRGPLLERFPYGPCTLARAAVAALLAAADAGGGGCARSGSGDEEPAPWEHVFWVRAGEADDAVAARVCGEVLGAAPGCAAGGGGDPAARADACAGALVAALPAARPDARALLTRSRAAGAAGLSSARVRASGFWEEVEALEGYLVRVGAVTRGGGAADGVASISRLLEALDSARPPPRTVCEVGVDAGHTSLLWLLGAPDAHVVAFDLGPHVTRWAAVWLTRRFPGRYTLVLGDSVDAIPRFHAAQPDVICDLWFIDGGHTRDVAAADAAAARAMARPGATVLFDDVTNDVMDGFGAHGGPLDVWLQLLESGAVAARTEGAWRARNGRSVPGTAVGYAEAIGWFM